MKPSTTTAPRHESLASRRLRWLACLLVAGGLVATLIWIVVAVLSWTVLVERLVAWVGGVPPGAWLMGSDVGAVAVAARSSAAPT